MRTTLDIEEAVLIAAKAIARDEGTSIGVVLSRLARRGLSGNSDAARSSKFPTFPAVVDSTPMTLDTVNEFRDDE